MSAISASIRAWVGRLSTTIVRISGFIRHRDNAAIAWMRRRWKWLGPLILAIALYWPIFLPGYHLNGGFAHEIVMVNGLRGAFNQSILQGHLPLWNEWTASGKIFLIFGAYPLNFMTPFELLFGPSVDETTYKFELVIVASIGAALFLWLGRTFSLLPVSAVLGFFSCYLMAQMPYQTGLVQSANFYLWGAAAVACTLLYFATGNRRLVALFLLFAFLAALGARPDVFPALLLFLGGLVGLRLCENLITQPRAWRHALKDFFADTLTFAVLPFAFYLWQLPLLLALAKAAGARLKAVTATAEQSFEYFRTAIELSIGGHILLSWLLGLAALNLGRLLVREWRSVALAKPYLSPKLIAVAVSISLLTVAAIPAILSLSAPAQLLSVVALVAVLLRAAVHRFSDEGSKDGTSHFIVSIERQLAFRIAWIWPVAIAGVHCALVEDPLATNQNIDIHFIVRAAFLLSIFYATGEATEDDGTARRRFLRYLVLCLGLGWVFRDFISLPLYDATTIIWATPRDLFWYVPSLAILFAFGCNAAIRDTQRTIGCLARLRSLSQNSTRRRLRAIGLSSIGLLVVIIAYEVLTVFYVPVGAKHRNEVWQHMDQRQAWASAERWTQRDRLNRQSLLNCGPDARIVVLPFPEIGFPGAEARNGIRNAWGYDYVNDHYRSLAEAAFEVPLGTKLPPIEYPRLYHYNVMAGHIYNRFADQFPSLDQAGPIYLRYHMLANGPRLDPFFLQLMGVCGLMLYESTDQFEPFEEQLTATFGGNKTYTRLPSRKPERFAFLPADGRSAEELLKVLQSEDRAELVALYDQLLFKGEPGAGSGVEISSYGKSPDQLHVRIRTDRPGILIMFDAWDPNWVATANNVPVSVNRAFVAMRAVAVDKGTSDIDFQYRVAWLRPALILSIAAFVFAIWWGVRAIKSARKPNAGKAIDQSRRWTAV